MKKKKHVLLVFYLKTLIVAGIIVFLGIYHYMSLNAQSTPDPSLEQRNAVGYTPLMLAANAGNTEQVKQLLAQGADVNAKASDDYGMSVLELAVFNGNEPKTTEIVDILLKAGANTALQDKRGNTALHQVVNVTSPGAKEKVAYMLMDYQAPINRQNFDNGDTPMHSIVKVPQLDLAKYMFNTFGPMMDLSIKSKLGYTVVDLARDNVVVDVLNPYLERHGQRFGVDDGQARNVLGYTGLMLAIIRDDYTFAKQQIELRDADVNAQANNRYGNYPLQLACMRRTNVLPYIKLLLDKGAKPRLANKAGNTPLHMVSDITKVADRKEVAKLLLQKGAYLLATNSEGNTPLHVAVMKKDTDMITFFKKQLGTWVKNKKGLTAQELATIKKLRVLR